MARTLSTDLRTRVIAAVDGGLSRRAAAERFGDRHCHCDPLGADIPHHGSDRRVCKGRRPALAPHRGAPRPHPPAPSPARWISPLWSWSIC